MSILDEIVAHKRKEIAQVMKQKPLKALQSEVAKRRLKPVGFRMTLERAGGFLPVIAEIKAKSPSRGMLKKDCNVRTLAQDYAAHGAAALSVLTDHEYFGGDLKNIEVVRAATKLPILRKDFILDPYQVYESLAAGADALLLIAEVLSKTELVRLKALADKLELDTLIEIHREKDLPKIASFKNALIGINNRDLHTFEVNLKTTARLRPRLAKTHFVVSESGVQSHEDLVILKGLGVGAVLVGESLMQAPQPGLALEKLLSPPAH